MKETPSFQFFEGPEKKVEIVVDGCGPSLRSLGDGVWRGVVERAGAAVVSTIANESCTAHLLSESSLFIYDERVIMITCGRTTLAPAVISMLDIIPVEAIRYLVYERKNEHFPEYQPSNFYEDVRLLRARLPGRAFRFGEADEHHIFLFHLERSHVPDPEDVTLEILMHGIDRGASETFCSGPERRLETIHERTGVCDILPGFSADDYLFEPMGYSLNAIRGREYFTLHVTPQETGSYVSFETNHRRRAALDGIVRRLVEIFGPRSLDVVFFQPAGGGQGVRCGYQLRNETRENLDCGFEVRFSHYFRPPRGVRKAEELSL